MPLVKMKEKGQITIPAAVREQIAAHKGDIFEVTVLDGNIVLTPQDVVARAKSGPAKKGVDISRFIGSGKGLFDTPEDVDTFIRSERDQWE
jgi:AbrB family looped-hinge helix DNA binding protein